MKHLLLTLGIFTILNTGKTQVKISELPVYTGTPVGATVPVVVGGINRKMDGYYFANMKIDSVWFSGNTMYVKKNNVTVTYNHTHPQSEVSGLIDSLLNKVSRDGSYANPSWITSLAWGKITGTPAFITLGDSTTILAGRWLPNRSADTASALQGRIQTKQPLLGYTPIAPSDTAAMKATQTLDRVLANGNVSGRYITVGAGNFNGNGVHIRSNNNNNNSLHGWLTFRDSSSNTFATIRGYRGADADKGSIKIYTGVGGADLALTIDDGQAALFTGSVTAPTFIGALTGNASTATALQTARTINGVSFNGTANINILNGTGFVKVSGTTISYDNTSYVPISGGVTMTGNLTWGDFGAVVQVGNSGSFRAMNGSDYASIFGTGFSINQGGVSTFLVAATPSSTRTVSIPNASGTLALTDGTGATGTWNIGISGNAATVTNGVYTTTFNSLGDARYLQLTGGTLSGALSGTTANFTRTSAGTTLTINNTTQYTQLDFANNGTAKTNLYWDNTAGTFSLYTSALAAVWTGANVAFQGTGTFGGALNGTTANFSGAGTFQSQIISTYAGSSAVLFNGSGTTNVQYIDLFNTGGRFFLGNNNSTGGSLGTNTTAYATVLMSVGAKPLEFGTNSTLRYSIDASGNNTWTGAGVFWGAVTATNLFLPNTGLIYFNSGDAAITNSGTSLLLKTYNGSSLATALTISGSGAATFTARINGVVGGTAYNTAGLWLQGSNSTDGIAIGGTGGSTKTIDTYGGTLGLNSISGNGATIGGQLTAGKVSQTGSLQATSVKTSNYTLTGEDKTIIFDVTSGSLTATLPAGVDNTVYTIKKYGSTTNTVTINRAGSDLIDGFTSWTISQCYSAVTIQFKSGTWYVISEFKDAACL